VFGLFEFFRFCRLVSPSFPALLILLTANSYKLLGFFNWRSTDIPELDPRVLKKKKEAAKH